MSETANKQVPILLTTIPKAGTYFFGEVLSEIGAKNRHLHLARKHAENLLLCNDEVNKFSPSKAKIPLELSQALYTVQAGEFVFGHIARPLLNDFALNRFKFIYAHRDHKAAMTSEFYWFREIRQDMHPTSAKYNNLSPEDHFLKYLQLFGAARVRLFRFLDLWKNEPGIFTIDFDQFRSDNTYAEDIIYKLADYIGMPVSKSRANEILTKCLAKETKTKVARDHSTDLWTPEAEAYYDKLVKMQAINNIIYPTLWSIRALLTGKARNAI